MVRFMVVTFAFLAWAFYMLSGGANFDPDRARLESSDPLKSTNAPEPAAETAVEGIEVTRVSLDLTSVEDVLDGGGSQTLSALPQQSVPVAQAAAGTDTVEIIPSLVENATPESAIADGDVTSASYTAESVSLDTRADVRVVSGSRVNVRGGPGTSHGVVDTLVRGDEVQVLEDSGTGWVRIRAADDSTEGWMAASLLTRG